MKNIDDFIRQFKALEKELAQLQEGYNDSAEHLFHSIVEHMPHAIIILQDKRFAFANPAALELYGYKSLSDFTSTPPLDMISQDSHAIIKERINNAIAGSTNESVRLKILRPDKTPLYAKSISRPFTYKGKPAVLIASVDATINYMLEKQLEDLHSQLKNAESLSKSGNYKINLSTGLAEWSTGVYSIFEWPENLPVPTVEEYTSLVHPEDLELLNNKIAQCINNNKDFELTYRIFSRSGKKKHVHSKGKLIEDKNSHEKILFGVFRDISSEKKYQDDIAEREAFYRNILAQISEAVFLTDEEGMITWACENINHIFQQSAHKAIYKNIEFLLPETRKKIIKSKKRKTEVIFEKTIFLGANEEKILEISIKPFEKKASTFLLTAKDITALKRTQQHLEDALLMSRLKGEELQRLLKATQSIPGSNSFYDAASIIFSECKSLIQADGGYIALLSEDGKQNEVVYLDSGNKECHVDPEEPMPIRGLRLRAYQLGKAIFDNNFEKSHFSDFLPDGHVSLKNVLFAPLSFGSEIIGLLGLGNKKGGFDEHDARIATSFGELAALALKYSNEKQKLIESETKYKSLVEQTSVGVGISKDNKIEFANTSLLKTFGYDTLKEFQKKPLTDHVHPDDIPVILTQYDKLKNNTQKYPYTLEHRIITKQGNIRHLSVDVSEMQINGTRYSQGIFFDITDKIRVEKEKKKLAADLLYVNQKNELLTNIQEQFNALTKKAKLKSYPEWQRINAILKEKLNMEEDWEKLKFHFQELHSNFFETLKKKHPNLTPTDLRFCAYIKLNLTTKEIARMANIKPTSVQTSRVRLKKKMGLTQATDLAGYIMEV